jgi:hypothetical protein
MGWGFRFGRCANCVGSGAKYDCEDGAGRH